MSVIQALLLGIVAVLGWCEYIDGINKSTRPIVMCTLAGLVMGDLSQGIIIGGTMELATMGMMGVGISIPMNVTIAGVLGTAFAISGGLGVAAAVALAIPIGVIFRMGEHTVYAGSDIIASKILYEHKEKNTKRSVNIMYWLSFGIQCALVFSAVFLSLVAGTDVINSAVKAIPESVLNAVGTGTGLLTALGFALLFNLTSSKKTIAFYFIGFVFASFMQMSVISMAILGAAFALIAYHFTDRTGIDVTGINQTQQTSDGIINLDNLAEETQEEVREVAHLLTKSDLKRVFFRSFGLEAPFIYSRLQAVGFCHVLLPAIYKVYDTQEARTEAINRHLEFFNTNPELSTFIFGIVCSMEEQNALSDSFDTSSINAVKAGLMGPTAGVGDSVYWGILKTIATGIGCQFSLHGSILGPILFLLIFNIPHWTIRYLLTFTGYNLGNKIFSFMSGSNNLIQKITVSAGILGMTVLGAMTCNMISLSTPLVLHMANDVTLKVQDTLDGIIPGLLPLAAVFIVSALLRKQVKLLPLIFILLAGGIALNLLGIIA